MSRTCCSARARRHGALGGEPAADPRSRHALELQFRRHDAHRRRADARDRARSARRDRSPQPHARMDASVAVRRRSACIPSSSSIRRACSTAAPLIWATRARFGALRLSLSARRRVGRNARAARRLGRFRAHAGACLEHRHLRRALVADAARGDGRPHALAASPTTTCATRSPRRATKGRSSSSCRRKILSSCGSAISTTPFRIGMISAIGCSASCCVSVIDDEPVRSRRGNAESLG